MIARHKQHRTLWNKTYTKSHSWHKATAVDISLCEESNSCVFPTKHKMNEVNSEQVPTCPGAALSLGKTRRVCEKTPPTSRSRGTIHSQASGRSCHTLALSLGEKGYSPCRKQTEVTYARRPGTRSVHQEWRLKNMNGLFFPSYVPLDLWWS